MDVIKPNFIVVNGRCFRSFYSPSNEASFRGNPEEHDNYEEVVECGDETCQEEEEIQITQESDSMFVHSMLVPPEFYGIIIGVKGENLGRLERSTRCRIVIPKRGDSTILGKTVIIKSSAQKNVYSARRKILATIERSRSRLEPNHFISIPIADEQITERYNQFKFMVLRDRDKEPSKFTGICEEIFQDPTRFHLTICMLIILDCFDETNKVISILEKLYLEKIKDKLKLITVELQGLEYMNDDVTAVDVLYAKVHPSDQALQEIGDAIAEEFKKSPFISRERSKVVFHLTLLNSKFKLKKETGRTFPSYDRKRDLREKFDVKEIINRYGDYFFGETTVDTIKLSIRQSESRDGHYESVYKISLI